MIDVREYLDSQGRSPFGIWFGALDANAASKVTVALTRMGLGNLSNVEGVGEGVLEYRLDFGPGYRVYFGRDGDVLIILLAGGTKRRQQRDIEAARVYWADYKQRKRLARRAMALTREFKATVQARVLADPKFRAALLRDGIEAMLGGDVDAGKAILRDYIKATVGFERLGEETGTSAKSLIRMFGARGNPQARNLFSVIGHLQRHAGLTLHVTTKAS